MSDVASIQTLIDERTEIDTEMARAKARRDEINKQLASLVSGKKKRA